MARGKKRQAEKQPAQEEEEDDCTEVLDEEDATQEESQPPPPPPPPPADDSSDEDENRKSSKVPELEIEKEQQLAEFFGEHPMFYNKSLAEFKNTKKKDRLINEIAEKLDLAPSVVKLWFRSQRTMYGKLVKKKSGQARKPITDRQKWLLENLSFLKEHIQHRAISSQLGDVQSQTEEEVVEGPDEEVEEVGEDNPRVQGASQSHGRKAKRPNLDTAMLEFLESAKKNQELASQVDQALRERNDEKKMFMDFILTTLGPNMSSELWREFTKDLLNLAHTYQVRIERDQQRQPPVAQVPQVTQVQPEYHPPPPPAVPPQGSHPPGYHYHSGRPATPAPAPATAPAPAPGQTQAPPVAGPSSASRRPSWDYWNNYYYGFPSNPPGNVSLSDYLVSPPPPPQQTTPSNVSPAPSTLSTPGTSGTQRGKTSDVITEALKSLGDNI